MNSLTAVGKVERSQVHRLECRGVPSNCPNCGEPAGFNFCANCGQTTVDRRAPMRSLLGEFFSEFFSIDGRNARTLLALLVPGKLTVLFLDGKRASYAPPVRVYFVASLVFFLLIGFEAPDASKYNIWVDNVLVGKAEPDPSLSDLDLAFRGPFNPLLESRSVQLRTMDPQHFLDGFFAGLERTVPTTLILFVPLLAMVLKLLYARRPFFYVDHLIFAFHFQSFLFLALVLTRLLNSIGLDMPWPGHLTYFATFLLIVPAYLYFALRRVYRQSWLWTGLKWAGVGVLYLLLIQPVIIGTMYLILDGI